MTETLVHKATDRFNRDGTISDVVPGALQIGVGAPSHVGSWPLSGPQQRLTTCLLLRS